MDILSVLQNKVNKISKKMYINDDCPPIFTVSLIQRYGDDGKINKHEIGLTVIHNGQSYTRTLFPQLHEKYGYPCLEEEMKFIYNNTI